MQNHQEHQEHQVHEHVFTEEPDSHAERLAVLESETRHARNHDRDVKASLDKITETMSELAATTKVNAAQLVQIRHEILEVKKKADFIPNTLAAAIIATAVTFGITSLGSVSARPDTDKVEETPEVPLIKDDKEKDNGYGSS